MKIGLIWVGKTQDKYLDIGNETYIKRLKHYCHLDIIEIKDAKGVKAPADVKSYEANEILQRIDSTDIVVLLDERGKNLTSLQFSETISSWQLRSIRRVVFLIGGAFGFDDAVYQRADMQLSLSSMTFSHRMIRLFFLEQLYRAFTIIRNEKYHNE